MLPTRDSECKGKQYFLHHCLNSVVFSCLQQKYQQITEKIRLARGVFRKISLYLFYDKTLFYKLWKKRNPHGARN